MHTKELKGLENYVTVDAAGLRAELDSILAKSTQNAAYAAESHYVKFQLGGPQGLQAFIKIDMSSKPFLFWYCDLDERAVSPAVRKTIADFLWEKGGEKEKYLDLDAIKLEEVRQDFRETGVKVYISNVNIPDIHQKALQTIAERQGDLTPDEEKIIKLKSATRAETLQRIDEQAKQKSAPAVFQDAIPVAGKSIFPLFNLFSTPAKSDAAKSSPASESKHKPKL